MAALAILAHQADIHVSDLLVLATHGPGVLPGLSVGSIAVQVMPRAPCPVLLVRSDVAPAPLADRVRTFTDDAARYGPLVQRPLGLRIVPAECIVGSVGRAYDLGADVMPRHARTNDRQRYERIRAAQERGEILPPVELYKLGYDYYVLDKHHRVAPARALGQPKIDAVVTEFLPLDDADSPASARPICSCVGRTCAPPRNSTLGAPSRGRRPWTYFCGAIAVASATRAYASPPRATCSAAGRGRPTPASNHPFAAVHRSISAQPPPSAERLRLPLAYLWHTYRALTPL